MKRFAANLIPWTLLLFVALISVPRPAATQPPPERRPRMGEGHERHPRIREAVEALRHARDEMRAADTDFCGHKAAAMRATQEALTQLRQAVACDRH